jgi:hypothetical protein
MSSGTEIKSQFQWVNRK